MAIDRELIVETFVAVTLAAHGQNAIAFAEKRWRDSRHNDHVATTWFRVVNKLKNMKRVHVTNHRG